MDSALVFAGASFIGRRVCDRLRQARVPFKATSRTPKPGFPLCDLTQIEQVHAILKVVRPRWIFQCAGETAQKPAAELHRLHEAATESLLDAVQQHVPDAVVVLFGSAAEYGSVSPERLPIREDVPAQPLTAYGQSKLAQLRVAERLARRHGLRVHVVRPFNVLGPGLGPQFFVAALCERLRTLRKNRAFGPVAIANAHATRDWLDVRDVADAAVRLALHAPPPPGEVGLYNVASGVELPVLAVADHLCRLAGDFRAVPGAAAGSRSAIIRSCGDASRLRAATGWLPRFDWRGSVRDMWL